jgi:hypothetical protein
MIKRAVFFHANPRQPSASFSISSMLGSNNSKDENKIPNAASPIGIVFGLKGIRTSKGSNGCTQARYPYPTEKASSPKAM